MNYQFQFSRISFCNLKQVLLIINLILHRKKETLLNDLFLNEISVTNPNEDQRPNPNNSIETDAENGNGNFPNRLV